MSDILNTFLKAIDEVREKLEEPAPDAYWDRLLEILGLGPNGTKSEVIELVKELALTRGYAKLGADKKLERRIEELEEQLADSQRLVRANKDRRDEVREECQRMLKAFIDQQDRFVLDMSNKLSEL